MLRNGIPIDSKHSHIAEVAVQRAGYLAEANAISRAEQNGWPSISIGHDDAANS
jgi:hypothetical protein